jgi:alpha-N-acetylglucosaminidase
MKNKLFTLLLFLLSATTMMAGNDVKNAQALAKRLLPKQASAFIFEKMDADSDVFTLQSRGGKIVISGNNANSMAVGLNYYLKRYCLTTISWFKDDPIEMPQTLPMIDGTLKIKARMPMRFFLNYCTYGYSMPWFQWADWERLIDWMALNGVNLPLAITGQESVWYNVWKKYGLSDEEIRSYFTGPAFLAWHRMCNIDSWHGPLPMSWLKSQEALQKRIVARERELNMKPILPSFAGHIPAALLRIYPHLMATKVTDNQGGWGNFKDHEKYNCTFLNSIDPLFAKIQKDFLQEQTRLYGTDHIYGLDPFNEVDPPTLNVDSIGMISKNLYESLTKADKDAVWLQMAWTYYYKKYWNGDRQRALYHGAPQGKMILLDYFCENKELWRQNQSFFGQDYLWNYLGNFGGRNRLVGPTNRIFNRIDSVFAEGGKNMKGVGATLEALEPDIFPYELTLEKAWEIPENITAWQDNLADRHVGFASEKARHIYSNYFNKVLEVNWSPYSSTFIENRPTLRNWMKKRMPNDETVIPTYFDIVKLWREMTTITSDRDAYKLDLVNIGRQAMSDYFVTLWLKYKLAYQLRDVEQMRAIGKQMIEVLNDYDALLGCHPTFSMERWVNAAKDLGSTPEEKQYYERDARTIVTVWNNNLSGLNDYSERAWAGLVHSFYIPRWQLFIDTTIQSRLEGKDWDEKAYAKESFATEEKFANNETPIVYPKAQDPVLLSKKLLQKYFSAPAFQGE